MAQTQAQRKKALTEAQERLRLADEAVRVAQDARTVAYRAAVGLEREIRRNEPLTEAMKNCLILMHRNQIPLHLSTYSGREYWLNLPGSKMNIRKSVAEGLEGREILGAYVRDGVFGRSYPLSDWGKQVAEALAAAEGKG